MAKAKRKQATIRPRAGSITAPGADIGQRVDYGGVRIVNPPSTRVSRLLPGRGTRPEPVDMDIRGFVPSRPSAVVSSWVARKLARAARRDERLAETLRDRRKPCWFDTVAHLVADIVFDEIPYRGRDGAAWQLPEETLALGHGDCEDRATLLASALIAAGISPYNVRVALGTIAVSAAGKRGRRRHAHAWVVYRGEHGGWATLEPLPDPRGSRRRGLDVRYEPEYVFNGDHQWSTSPTELPALRRRWNELDPTFHGEVHRSIILDASGRAGLPDFVRSRMSRTFTNLFGNVIDEPDLAHYDPRHHFDSGLMEPAWGHVGGWLRHFYQKPFTDSEGVRAACWAAHAIGDFYAHSSYAHFLEKERAALLPFDPQKNQPALGYDYASDPEYSRASLSYYPIWYDPGRFDRFARWKGKPISGRYSFHNDRQQGLIERFVNEPPKDAFPTPAARAFAGSLPHHDEIAVDVEVGKNKLYPDEARYAAQYRLRYALAVQHITAALKKHPAR